MKLIILLPLLFTQLAYAKPPVKMEIIVNDEQKRQLRGVKNLTAYFKHYGGEFSIYSLDDVQHFEDRLSIGLSSNEKVAKKQAEKNIF